MPKLITKGDQYEYRVMRLFLYQGYLPRRRYLVKTSLEAKIRNATDVDVLAVRYSPDFIETRAIAECKFKGRTQPVGNILFTASLKALLDAQVAILALKTTPWDIKSFGSQVGVQVLSLPRIEEMEKELGIEADGWPASTDFGFYEPLWDEWRSLLESERLLERFVELLRTEFWFRSEWVIVNRLITAISELSKRLSGIAEHPPLARLCQWLLFEGVVHFSLATLRVCNKTHHLSPDERKGLLSKRLTYGDLDPDKVERHIQATYKFASEVAKQQLGEALRIPKDWTVIPAPVYTEDFVDLVERMSARPASAAVVAIVLELLLFEFIFKGREISLDFMETFVGGRDLKFKIKLAKDIVYFLMNNANLSESPFEALLGLW